MRAALLAVLALGAPLAAHADAPKLPDLRVWKNTVKKQPDGVKAITSVSHILYLNDCMPSGCTVFPGSDDSRTDHSSIAESQVHLDAYGYGSAKWDSLVQCARTTFAPFDVQIVTQDPGNTPHFEVMVGGRATQLNSQLQGAGGVAPFIDCSTSEDNVISFVFAAEVNNENFLCGAIAQEASHVWGLDHELDAKDPMTYLDLGSSKRFQDNNASCGEDTPRQCNCGGSTQNSVQFLNNAFGPLVLTPPSLQIVTPTNGQWVKPGFPIHAALTSQIGFTSANLDIDGTSASTITSDPLTFNAPANLGGGDHTVTVSTTDSQSRTTMASVGVHVTAACSSAAPCPSSFNCLGGFCLPGAGEAGGLGATCTDNGQCITGQCASDGTESLCTGQCDSGNVCPSGFTCLAASGVCWPSPDSGGCEASGGGASSSKSAGFALLAFGGLVLVVRRRRR
jgi:MYXO-CTERM domain-containing protein